MRGRIIILLFVSLILAVHNDDAAARRPAQTTGGQNLSIKIGNRDSDRPLPSSGVFVPFAATQLDTFVLATFSFHDNYEPSAQGWYGVDLTVNPDTFFHVAGTGELDGGDYGTLLPLEGAQSLWCGAAPSVGPLLCSYQGLPGYGNSWSQEFTSRPFARTGDVTLSYLINWHSEPYYDRTTVHYVDNNGDWVDLGAGPGTKEFYDFSGSLFESYVIPGSSLGDSVQVRFYFSSDGAFSDEDNMWDTDGAVIIDSLRLADAAGELDFQDFESEPTGAHFTSDGDWWASHNPSYGDHSVLLRGGELLQEDPCVSRLSGMWAFIKGSTADYSCGGHAEQTAVPHAKQIQVGLYLNEVYIDNEIWSPYIDWTQDIYGTPVPASASSAILEFDVYRDLPLDNLVFYFQNVRGVINDCPQAWPYPVMLGYGAKKDWFTHREEVAPRIPGDATHVQIALGVRDMCYYWCCIFGTGQCHSHAPLFDNVRLVRVDQKGPAWVVDNRHLFQDNFAADGTTTGKVHIDMARKHIYHDGRADSAMVTVVAPNIGIDYHLPGDDMSGPAAYCYVKDVSPAKSGAAMSGDAGRWPVVSTGAGWTKFRFDYTLNPGTGLPITNQYCFDLNDNLFTPGDTIYYYFSARDQNGNTNYYSVLAGVTGAETNTRTYPMEVTCLPANARWGVTDILYVDDFDNRGAQPFFEAAFEALGIKPDRYDVLDPDRMLGNGPGGRVVDVAQQIIGPYKTIIWNSGDLERGLIGDGTGDPSDTDDFALLYEFLDQSPGIPGLYVSGDNVAEEWIGLTGSSAVDLRGTYMNFNLTNGDHVNAGEPTSPVVSGVSGSCFHHPGTGPDDLIAFGGGCNAVNNFDVLTPYDSAAVAMIYSDNPLRGAIVSQVTQNAVGGSARVMLSGFSYHTIRDDETADPIDRVEHLQDILRWLQMDLPTPSYAVGNRFRNSLSQNYPNPFNPTTTISFTLKKRSLVTLKVFNVAGQVVKTLVSEPKPPGVVHSVTWDGTNNRGGPVASGVYFYKLTAGDFSRTRKMILLK